MPVVFGKGNREWRKHPLISNNHIGMFPGMKRAAVIFGIYCIGEYAYEKMNKAPEKKLNITFSKAGPGQRVTVHVEPEKKLVYKKPGPGQRVSVEYE